MRARAATATGLLCYLEAGMRVFGYDGRARDTVEATLRGPRTALSCSYVAGVHIPMQDRNFFLFLHINCLAAKI